ncbi:hypothetical protein [Paenibacillus agricola]|uniref:Uncharacterized protein n=1 Tax=Paenibacillus agricola TaxID=2716264 RepID=A0ABX0J2T7_9BACL|nr:hypothetical protein [Paenibacillus agricola]NHN30584.1 hypothetical protein [Paenibacillus agricola]
MSHVAWEQLVCAVSEQKQADYQQFIQNGGYSAFHHLLEGIKQKLRHVQDSEIKQFGQWIDHAQQLFPEPGIFSPSWSRIWEELKQILAIKSGIMQQIPIEERSGEWQIIIDNPLSIQEIVCHPALSFDEAAYLYSYFRPGLEKNEYIRLQKVLSLMTDVGY